LTRTAAPPTIAVDWRSEFDRRCEVFMQRSGERFPSARRSFLSRVGGGLAALGAALGAHPSTAFAQAPASWRPARHSEDDWFDRIPGKHRTFLDAVSAHGVGEALHFASNIIVTSKSGYGLESSEVAIIVCLRHGATAFAFNDAIWAKYSEPLSAQTRFTDPKSNTAPTKNLYNSPELRRDETFDALIKLGVHFAVCDKSTQGISANLARKTDGKQEAVYKELLANVVANGHMVPSGIVAAGHAQEHGYSYAYCG
jgi:hypothetical protein